MVYWVLQVNWLIILLMRVNMILAALFWCFSEFKHPDTVRQSIYWRGMMLRRHSGAADVETKLKHKLYLIWRWFQFGIPHLYSSTFATLSFVTALVPWLECVFYMALNLLMMFCNIVSKNLQIINIFNIYIGWNVSTANSQNWQCLITKKNASRSRQGSIQIIKVSYKSRSSLCCFQCVPLSYPQFPAVKPWVNVIYLLFICE